MTHSDSSKVLLISTLIKQSYLFFVFFLALKLTKIAPRRLFSIEKCRKHASSPTFKHIFLLYKLLFHRYG